MGSLAVASLAAWTPIRVRGGADAPLVDWAVLDAPFTAPFFEQTVNHAMEHPFNQVFARTTPLDVLDALAEQLPPVAPAGLVFHMSRCGSTLIAQMLAQLSSAVMLSEPQPLDGVLGLHRAGAFDRATAVLRLRSLLGALSRPHTAAGAVFVKFFAWQVLDLPLIAQAFPGVPWVFAFREPRDVLRSQERLPGAEVVPGVLDPRVAGVEPAALAAISPGAYCARVLAAFCNAALEHGGTGRARYVAYDTLPDEVFSDVLPWFGVSPDASETQRMRTVATIDAKSKGDAFRPPTTQSATSSEIDRLAAEWLDPLYERLRALSG